MASQNIDTVRPAEQDIAEKLRLLESIFAKLHPDVSTDDLAALRNYDLNNGGHEPLVRTEETAPQFQALNSGSHPDEVGDELGDLGRHEGIGKTPMPTATITVINQGKTRM